jgi:hypothetical protein
MGVVFLSRSECRDGFWHTVLYDITDPDNWIELEVRASPFECSAELPIGFQETGANGYDGDDRKPVAVHRELFERPHTAVLISPRGHAVAITHQDGSTVVEHRDASGKVIDTSHYDG